tara:strand:+ start:1929 stop:2195 length:267 start_codon:yes stop_codon:yes gene_type:complete
MLVEVVSPLLFNSNRIINLKFNIVKKDLFKMGKYFLVILAIVTSIIVGGYGMGYALMNALLEVLIFIISVVGFLVGLLTLNMLVNNIK